MKNNIVIGSDHAGYLLKESVCNYLKSKNYSVDDKGPFNDNSVDYPDYAHLVASSVDTDENVIGILICGSGNGVCITANKYKKVRAALCWNNEISELARLHNDANIICVPARFISEHDALQMIDTFLNTAFEGGRHCTRVNKISNTL